MASDELFVNNDAEFSSISQNDSVELFSELSDSQNGTESMESVLFGNECSAVDDNLSADNSMLESVKRKYAKRSHVEKQLETNMTTKVTELCETSSPDGSSPNRSRYGRARKQKTIVDFYPTDFALQMKSKLSKTDKHSPKSPKKLSPAKSPVKVSPVKVSPVKVSPVKVSSSKLKQPVDISNALSPFYDDRVSPSIETKLLHTPWNEGTNKLHMKVYVRKDLIQRRREEKEETGSLMKSMFSVISPQSYSYNITSTPSPKNTSGISQHSNTSFSSPLGKYSVEKNQRNSAVKSPKKSINLSLVKNDKKSAKKSNKGSSVKKSDEKLKEKTLKKQNSSIKKKLAFEASNITNGVISNVKQDCLDASPPAKIIESVCYLEEEKSCSWKLGELAWARVGSHPFWPCLITRDPLTNRFVKTKTVGRSNVPVEVIHVTFFADSGRRSWLSSNYLMRFEGNVAFQKAKDEITPEMRKKDPKLSAAYNVGRNKLNKWAFAVEEAEMLVPRPMESREEYFFNMLMTSNTLEKKIVKPKKDGQTRIKTEKDTEVSLSESLFDSLFGEKDTDVKLEVKQEVTNESQEPKSNIDIVDLVVNDIAAKTGNDKIKTQSHMDRWLLKAKRPINKSPVDKISSSVADESNSSKNNVKTVSIRESKRKASKSPIVSKINVTDLSPEKDSSENESNIPLKKRKLIPDVLSGSCEEDKNAEPTKSDEPITNVVTEDVEMMDVSKKEDEDVGYNQEEQIDIEESVIIKVEGVEMMDDSKVEDIAVTDEDVGHNQEQIDIEESVIIKVENEISDNVVSDANTPRILSLRKRKSNVTPTLNKIDNIGKQAHSNKETHIDAEEMHVKEQVKITAVSKNPCKYDDPDFQEFLEFKRDALLEENPDLTEEYILSYLYKAWQYGESQKTDDMKNDDDFCLVKGMTDDVSTPEPKKPRKRNKEVIEDENAPSSPTVSREKSLRKKSIKAYFKEESDVSDAEEGIPKETKIVESSSSGGEIKLEGQETSQSSDSITKIKDEKNVQIEAKTNKKIQQETKAEITVEEKVDPHDYYMKLLPLPKPNLFKGLSKEKVCELCEKPSRLLKCKGACGGVFHYECVQKKLESNSLDDSDEKQSKKKKKKGRKSMKKKASLEEDNKDNISKVNLDYESGEDSQANLSIKECSNDTTATDKKTESRVIIQPHMNGEIHLSPVKKMQDSSDGPKKSSPVHFVTDAENFEEQLAKKMQEMLETAVNPDLDLSSASSTDGDLDWKNVQAGQCVIVDAQERKPKDKLDEVVSIKVEPQILDTFKCNKCLKYETPVCFVCQATVCAKNNVEDRQKCNVIHCNKYYHVDCLKLWPQTKYSTGALSKNQKKNLPYAAEALSCPRHVCHTCVSDDPRGCRTRFSGDKLAKCVRCPATYHCFTQCVPAGSRILTASQIICPRHSDSKPGKNLYHVNTSWCFICAKGGSLICCETCPTSFHAECLKISPPEGGYICEDCETGRLPLYGELVWVKLGQYRWWPALVLHPSDVPRNIQALSHAPNQFAVRFFGDYDHYWINSGRVFPYQEGDTGHATGRKTAVNSTFLTAVKQAQEAYDIIKNLKERESEEGELVSSLLPPQYVKLKINRPVGGAALLGRVDKFCSQKCDCDPKSEIPCAPDSDCLNRMLLTECSPSVCAAGDRCGNQAFEKRLYPPLAPSRTMHRGWGLKALADIKKGDFVIEYVGEVIDEVEFQRRMARRQEIRDENYYFLTLDKDRMIDAGPKGNVARFMNHSCEPNCETQKWTVNGDIRVGLFALQDIPAGSEVTFNYNLVCAGDDKKRCMCGTKRCAGFIGAKPKQDEVVPKNPKKVNLKRRSSKKKLENTPSSSPVNTKPKDRTSTTSSGRRKSSHQTVVEPIDELEKDLMEIVRGTSELEKITKPSDSEESQLTGLFNINDGISQVYSAIESQVKLEGTTSPLDSSKKKNKDRKIIIVEDKIIVDPNNLNRVKKPDDAKDSVYSEKINSSCKGFEKEFASFIISNRNNDDVLKLKRTRKRTSTDSARNKLSADKSIDKINRSKSSNNSKLNKSNTVRDVISDSAVNGHHVKENGIDCEKLSSNLIDNAMKNGDVKGVKCGKRGSKNNSILLVDEI